MGLFPNMTEIRSSLATPEQWLIDFWSGGLKSKAGVYVTEGTALNYLAYYECVKILTDTMLATPLHLYRRLPGGGKERATDHPLYNVLRHIARPDLPASHFRETLQGHLATWGNAYAHVVRNRGRHVVELHPLLPGKMEVSRKDGVKRFRYDNVDLDPNEIEILHIPGFGYDGVIGYSPITIARESIGLGMGLEEFAADYFGRGMHPGGIIEYPGRLSDDARNKYQKAHQEKYAGLGKSHDLMVLESGFKYTQVGIPPDDSQFLESRVFQKREMAAFFRIPQHMVGDQERATFSNIEHLWIEFITSTMLTWYTRWEDAIYLQLLNKTERETLFPQFLTEVFLKGDTKSRYEAYNIGRNGGWLSVDDIRDKENMNPLPEGKGQIYLEPLNMKEAGIQQIAK